jgi:hypothetical protein
MGLDVCLMVHLRKVAHKQTYKRGLMLPQLREHSVDNMQYTATFYRVMNICLINRSVSFDITNGRSITWGRVRIPGSGGPKWNKN